MYLIKQEKSDVSRRASPTFRITFIDAFDFEDRRGLTDPKFAYPEPRYLSLGLMRGKLVALVYSGTDVMWRIISLRLATEKEAKTWLGK